MINQTPAEKLVAMAQQLVENEEQQTKCHTQDVHELERHAYADGFQHGTFSQGHEIAQAMRVLLCALMAAHKRNDEAAFLATFEIAKHQLSKYDDFNNHDWYLFRHGKKLQDGGAA